MLVFSKLDADKLKSINDMESKLGVNLIAFSDINTKYADLGEAEAKDLKDLEKELGLSLVALKMD
ncbi:MAG: hypothetical protein U9N13_08525 [Euryarchaeota archaeon]|nr:hypothetical protein [Euryarchaeota archaeon]